MLTPMRPDLSIDFEALDRLIEWYLQAGVAGLFACCLSSEVYELTEEEKRELGLYTLRRVAGRAPVVVGVMGTLAGEPRRAAARRYLDAGAAAVVFNVAELAAEEASDDSVAQGFDALLEELPDEPIGLYECPRPYHRLLTTDLLARFAASGRLRFLKDTSCNGDTIRARLNAVERRHVRLFSAHTPSLLGVLRDGGDGFSGLGSNFVPDLYVWLCENVDREPELATRMHETLTGFNATIHRCYPAAAKAWLNAQGVTMSSACRMDRATLGPKEFAGLERMATEADDLRDRLAGFATST